VNYTFNDKVKQYNCCIDSLQTLHYLNLSTQ